MPTLASQTWTCMRGEPQGITFNSVTNTTLTEELYADGYTMNGDAYIVSCVGTVAGGVCTTGNSAYDKLIFNADNTAAFPYPVTITGGSKQKIELGKLKATATVTTQGLTGGLTFYGVTIGDDALLVGKGPAQKLGTVPFSELVTTKCVSISWNTVFPPPAPSLSECHDSWENEQTDFCRKNDPFGIVFDSQSLEPLPNIQVTIFDKNKNKYFTPGLTNPQTTLADGLFNFLVEPGIYYLSTSLPNGYSFTSNPNLHQNYVKIYHQIDGTNSIYKPDEPVAEIIDTPEEAKVGKPDMEHRDIPLDPGTGAPYNAQPSTITYQMYREGIMTKVDGKVSHPFTDITFSQSGNLVVKVKTDRFGFYKTEFNNTSLSQDQEISVLYTKADLKTIDIIEFGSAPKINVKLTASSNKIFDNLISTVLSHLATETFAQSSIKITSSNEAFKLSPIFPYIEGYSYDQNNRIAPNATVRLKLKMNKASFYETKSDNNGYFKIDPKHVPLFPYYLEIVPKSGSAVDYSTAEFAKQNKEYLSENKINLIEGTKDKISLISGTPSPSTQSDILDSNTQSSKTSTDKIINNEKKSINSSMVFLLFIIFIFVVLIGLTIFFILKNKKGNQALSEESF